MPVCRVPDCEQHYGCRLRAKGVTFLDAATPSRHFTSSRVPSTERQWSQDMKSYKALRAQGLQPRQIDGCNAIEAQAKSAEDVERAVPRKTSYAQPA